MRRRLAFIVVGSSVLVSLAGCGRWGSQEREAWRREAEVACMRSGAVKASATVVPIKSIDGPGMCGAEHPLKVAELGSGNALGFADVRPPASVGSAFPIAEPRRTYEPPRAPMQIHPANTDGPDDEPDVGEGPEVSGEAQRALEPPPRMAAPRAPALTTSGAQIQPPATLACPIVSVLDRWMAADIQPAAQRWFGQPVIEIKQISAYSCRGMNGNRHARISEHAFGNALDIAAFTLADGRRVTVKGGWRGAPEEQGFLRDVHASACNRFSTVLAPGSNVYHYDHIHVDLARRRGSRGVCNPRAIPGDQIARRPGPGITGSVGARGAGRLGFTGEDGLPAAQPGAD